jgi:hypothetical protein
LQPYLEAQMNSKHVSEQQGQLAETVFLAFLAALYKAGFKQINDSGDALHESFAKGLDVLRSDVDLQPALARFKMGAFSGRIDALDQALIRAEQFGWVQFPNPSYERMTLAMSPSDAEHLLSQVAERRPKVEEAATAFREYFAGHAW